MPPEAEGAEWLAPLRACIGDEPLAVESIGTCGVRIVLARPEKRNAISAPVARVLTELFRRVAVMADVRIVFIAARGEFCAGADLDQKGGSPEENIRHMAALFQAIAALPQYSVALVSGVAFGAGTGIVAACDGAIATSDARFATPEARVGLIPSVISPYILAAVGRRAATRLFATAAPIDAEQALAIGLVDAVVADRESLDREADGLSRSLALAAPEAVREAKRLAEFAGRPRDEGLIEETVARTLERMASVEVREGLRAFREKRRAAWSGEESAKKADS